MHFLCNAADDFFAGMVRFVDIADFVAIKLLQCNEGVGLLCDNLSFAMVYTILNESVVFWIKAAFKGNILYASSTS